MIKGRDRKGETLFEETPAPRRCWHKHLERESDWQNLPVSVLRRKRLNIGQRGLQLGGRCTCKEETFKQPYSGGLVHVVLSSDIACSHFHETSRFLHKVALLRNVLGFLSMHDDRLLNPTM